MVVGQSSPVLRILTIGSIPDKEINKKKEAVSMEGQPLLYMASILENISNIFCFKVKEAFFPSSVDFEAKYIRYVF